MNAILGVKRRNFSRWIFCVFLREIGVTICVKVSINEKIVGNESPKCINYTNDKTRFRVIVSRIVARL